MGRGGDGAATPRRDAALRLTHIQQTQSSAGPVYAVRDAKTTPHLLNPAHRLLATFGPDGARIGRGEHEVSLAWTGIGRASSATDVGAALGDVVVRGNEVHLQHRDGLEQWFVNGPLGIEQGFTVAERPDGAGDLVLEVTVDGALPELAAADVRLVTDEARPMHYSDLFAQDAGGALLPAHFEVRGQRIALVIDDATAVYPLRIDTLMWSEDDKLTASDAQFEDKFGYSVAISGNRAIVGSDGFSGVLRTCSSVTRVGAGTKS